jgi:hypothetical protein
MNQLVLYMHERVNHERKIIKDNQPFPFVLMGSFNLSFLVDSDPAKEARSFASDGVSMLVRFNCERPPIEFRVTRDEEEPRVIVVRIGTRTGESERESTDVGDRKRMGEAEGATIERRESVDNSFLSTSLRSSTLAFFGLSANVMPRLGRVSRLRAPAAGRPSTSFE